MLHPRLYGLCKLNSQDAIHAHKQIQVPLAIKDYTNMVICNVFSIAVVHVLLEGLGNMTSE